MPERFEIYIVYKRCYINTLPFLLYYTSPAAYWSRNATPGRSSGKGYRAGTVFQKNTVFLPRHMQRVSEITERPSSTDGKSLMTKTIIHDQTDSVERLGIYQNNSTLHTRQHRKSSFLMPKTHLKLGHPQWVCQIEMG